MFLNEFKEEFEVNGSCNAMNEEVDLTSVYDGVLESYINDYTIFEAVLRRDFLEVNGLLTEAGNENFFKTIWKKIKEFCGKIKQWIKNILERFKNAISMYKETKIKQKMLELLPYFKDPKADELLKEFKIKGYKIKSAASTMAGGESVFDNILEKYINPIVDDPVLKKDPSKLTEEDLKKISEKLNNAPIEDIAKELRSLVYTESDIEKPFANDSELKKNLLIFAQASQLITFTGTNKKMEFISKTLFNNIDKLSKNADKIISGFTNLSRNMGDEVSEDDENLAKTTCQQLLKILPSLQSKCNSISSMIYSELMKETKEFIRLYMGAGKYLKGKLKKGSKDTSNNTDTADKKEDNKEEKVGESFITDDLDYINVVTEAEMYELGL